MRIVTREKVNGLGAVGLPGHLTGLDKARRQHRLGAGLHSASI